MSQKNTLNEKYSKETWFKKHLLLNLGFVPKVFGYTDLHIQTLIQNLKEYTAGVEYYFGISPGWKFLTKNKLVSVIHAPFAPESYPWRVFSLPKRRDIIKWVQFRTITRPDTNARQRLTRAIETATRAGIPVINIHACDIMFEPDSAKFFKELDALKNITICLENNVRHAADQKNDKPEWSIAHNPIHLVRYLQEHNLKNLRITIDTAHLANSGYDVQKVWQEIKQICGDNINRYISHWHIVDYNPKKDFDAEPPGEGDIGIDVFRGIINDLYELGYSGTISLEVAPLYFRKQNVKLLSKILSRKLHPYSIDLKEEEEYIVEIIRKLI